MRSHLERAGLILADNTFNGHFTPISPIRLNDGDVEQQVEVVLHTIPPSALEANPSRYPRCYRLLFYGSLVH
jgi:hypothetical protein